MLKVIPLQKQIKSIKPLEEADVLEIWADNLTEKEQENIIAIAKKLKKPLIYKVTTKDSENLNKTVITKSKYIDVDLSAGKKMVKKIRETNKKIKIIVSHHDFEKTPYEKELKKIVSQMLKLKPDIIKIATYASSISDSFRMLDFLENLNKKGIKAICIGMGEHGLLTRIAGDLFGNYMMYFALDKKTASAPGQITIQEFKKHRNES